MNTILIIIIVCLVAIACEMLAIAMIANEALKV